MKNRFNLIAVLVFCAFAFTTCNKNWDDHNAITDVAVANNLFENISKNPSLSKFAQYLSMTGYDKIIAGSKTYTVWAPTDAALATLDASVFADTAQLRSFVGNHISNQAYLAGGVEQRILMLNGKYNKTVANTFDLANITTPNLYAANGVYHVIDKYIPRYDNCWEFMRKNLDAPMMRSYLLSQDYNFFDASLASQTGVNSNGDPVYDTTSGLVKKNRFLESVLDVNDEKSQYTMILMNDASFTTEFNKLSPWFKTAPTTDSTSKLTSFWLAKDLVFRGAYSLTQLPDTLVSVSGVKVPINKPSIISSFKTSNGWVHIMSKVDFTLTYKFPPVIIQGENPSSFAADRSGNTQYRIRFNPLSTQNFTDILMQNYNYANYFIRYTVKNLPSMRYNAFWVAVNDVQTTPLWNQRLAIDSTTSAATNLPFVTVAYKNYSEVPLGQLNIANYRNLNLYVMGPTTASTAGGVNSIVLDYIKLVPAF